MAVESTWSYRALISPSATFSSLLFSATLTQFPSLRYRSATRSISNRCPSGNASFEALAYAPRAARRIENNPLSGWRANTAVQLVTIPSSMVIVQVSGPEGKVIAMAQKANGLAHTKWVCKHRIVFTPKYRSKVVYSQYRRGLGQILRTCAGGRAWRQSRDTNRGTPDAQPCAHAVGIPPKISVSSFMRCLKGKNSLLMFVSVNVFHRSRQRVPAAFGQGRSSFPSSPSMCASNEPRLSLRPSGGSRLSARQHEAMVRLSLP